MTAKVFTANGEDVTEQITAFASTIGLERSVPGRYSVLLALGLFVGYISGQLNPAKVVYEIEALEGIGTSRLKPPTSFKRPPLKGLWHKHYFPDGIKSIALNVKKGLDIYGMPFFKQLIHEAQEAGEERFFSIDHVKPLVDDIVYGHMDRLSAAAALTGEWVIFAKHEGVNYYLSLGTHDPNGHKTLRQAIDSVCCLEFSFLSKLLSDA